MELGFVPLVDRTVSRCMFRGSCGLRNTSGSLSPDGWICAPALLVVWPETSQHWSLWAVGWDQVLASKCQPPGLLLPMSAPQYIHHKCFCPWSDPQPPPTSPEDPLRPAGRFGQALMKSLLFPLGPSQCAWNLCVPSSSGVSISLSPVKFLWSNPFKAKCSGDFS